jgi:hypothetical protein
MAKRISFRAIPPEEDTEGLEFGERINIGFRMALRTGTDVIYSIASVLVKVGESMSEQAQKTKFSPALLKPPVLSRLILALLRSKRERRSILPKDLWKAKAIMTAGTDVRIYKDKITHYWGQTPYEIYGGTEVFIIAIQNWNKKWLTFAPDTAFWELIPEEERLKSKENPGYQPATVLLDEVKSGNTYEVVLTHFHGMPLLRYRVGDLVTVVSMRDDESGTKLPQILFKSRADDIIALAGLAQLDESTIWQALVDSGLKYEDWSARKEYDSDQVYLRLYLELKGGREVHEIEHLIDQRLKDIHVDYKDLETMAGLQPVRVTVLTQGTFQRYYEEKQKEGADLAHLKPPHVNASDTIIQRLIKISQEVCAKR